MKLSSAIGLVEMPFSLVPGTIYVLILYFLAGFPASKFGFFYFNFFIFMWSAISLGQTVATFSPNPMVAYVSVVFLHVQTNFKLFRRCSIQY